MKMNCILKNYSTPSFLLLKLITVLFLLNLTPVSKAEDVRHEDSINQFLERHCIDCHSGAESESGLDLEKLKLSLTDKRNFSKWVRLFDRVADNEMPPPDSKQPTDRDRKEFKTQLSELLSEHERDLYSKIGRTRLRRLNRVEYENTLHDLLGISTPLQKHLPEETPAHGFDTVSAGLRISPQQIEQYLYAADIALDNAIRLTSKPVLKKQRYRFHDEKEVLEMLEIPHAKVTKPGVTHRHTIRKKDDAIVFISPGYAPDRLHQFTTKLDGTYHVKVSAYATNSDSKPISMEVLKTNWKENSLLGYFDMPENKPRVVELEVPLVNNEFLQFKAFNVGYDKDGKTIWNFDDLSKLKVPGLAIQWVEIEGPFYDQWPPKSVNRLFDSSLVRERKPRGPWTPQGHLDYEIFSEQPEVDARKIIERFAQRAFRQTPNPRVKNNSEYDPYVNLALAELKAGKTFEQAVRTGIRSILVSPRFLILDETPGKLEDVALASRLAYFLTSSMPDEKLLKIASENKLSQSEILDEEINRLLDSPRSNQFLENFVGQWLDLRSIDATSPDLQLYPEFDLLLRESMLEETESFIRELIDKDLPIRNLIDSDFVMINSRLAEHYDIEIPTSSIPTEKIQRVKIKGNSHRGGLITHASILKVTANGTVTSPVRRGTWVLSNLLGQPPSPPPPVPAVEPDTRGATTIRELLAKHRNADVCNSCHKDIDPPGFAMESFDVIGGYRERYRSNGEGKTVKFKVSERTFTVKESLPVDSSGKLPDGRKFDDIIEFKKLLLQQEDQVIRCLTEKLVTYSTGSPVRFVDRIEIDRIVHDVKTQGGGFRTLLKAVIHSPLFTHK